MGTVLIVAIALFMVGVVGGSIAEKDYYHYSTIPGPTPVERFFLWMTGVGAGAAIAALAALAVIALVS